MIDCCCWLNDGMIDCCCWTNDGKASVWLTVAAGPMMAKLGYEWCWWPNDGIATWEIPGRIMSFACWSQCYRGNICAKDNSSTIYHSLFNSGSDQSKYKTDSACIPMSNSLKHNTPIVKIINTKFITPSPLLQLLFFLIRMCHYLATHIYNVLAVLVMIHRLKYMKIVQICGFSPL